MASASPERPIVKVEVVNFDIPFVQMIWLMIKWTIAAIPALIVLFVIGAILTAVLGGTLLGLTGFGQLLR